MSSEDVYSVTLSMADWVRILVAVKFTIEVADLPQSDLNKLLAIGLDLSTELVEATA